MSFHPEEEKEIHPPGNQANPSVFQKGIHGGPGRMGVTGMRSNHIPLSNSPTQGRTTKKPL